MEGIERAVCPWLPAHPQLMLIVSVGTPALCDVAHKREALETTFLHGSRRAFLLSPAPQGDRLEESPDRRVATVEGGGGGW